MSEPGDSQNCLNCGVTLAGQYCGQCGQRATSRLISLWELVRDAFGDLFELDSRLWRTLVPLLIRPGLLTRDYLEGRRARFMPPFRMYLVLSLVFFVVAFFDPREDLAIFYEPAPTSEVETKQSEEDLAEARRQAQQTLEDLANEGIITLDNDDPGQPAEADDAGQIIVSSEGINFGDNCTLGEFDLGDAPQWLKRRITAERVVSICERLQAAGSKGFARAVLDNIPAGLIVLLPLMALALKILYPLSRRFYVEHLLFFVHFHSFFFLILSLQILFSRIGRWLGWFETLFTLTIVAASFYIPVYLFVAMRHVYGQGRIVTFLKYVVLLTTYFLGFSFVMLGAVLIAAFSI